MLTILYIESISLNNIVSNPPTLFGINKLLKLLILDLLLKISLQEQKDTRYAGHLIIWLLKSCQQHYRSLIVILDMANK